MIVNSTYLVVLLGFLCGTVVKAQQTADSTVSRGSIPQAAALKPATNDPGLGARKYLAFPAPGDDSLTRKKFGHSALLLMASELTPWVVDRYVRQMDYAVISFKTVAHNLKPRSWTWDGDGFITNQFGHPYHGSLFYNSFRVNGYNFWGSSVAAFAGSFLWEVAAENQEPAPNDLINTGFGGIIMGEMTYRLANKIIDNRSRGFKRQSSEIVAFIVNPINGFSRLVRGQWGRFDSNPGRRDSTDILADFNLGLRQFKANRQKGEFGLFGRIRFVYGTGYAQLKKPFSNINISIEFGKDDSSLVNNVHIDGSLIGWNTRSGDRVKQAAIVTANYDFIRNQAFFYSAQSIRLSLNTDVKLWRAIKLTTTIGAGPIVLASVPDPYMFKERFYDYCAGAGFHGTMRLDIGERFTPAIGYRGGWLKTLNGHSSHHFLHAFTAELRYKLKSGYSVAFESGYLDLYGKYKAHQSITNTYPFLRIAARYNFKVE
jgi:hypothetical protein